MRKLWFCLAFSLHATLALSQQTNSAPPETWQTVFFEMPTKALPLLTKAAIEHSAQLNALEVEKSINQLDVKLTKQKILDAVSFGGSYTYGNLSSVALADPLNSNQFNTFSSSRYSTGVLLALPLGQIVGRGNQIRKEELNLRHTEAVRQDREDQIRQQLISLYQNVLLARKLLTIQQDAYVTVQTRYDLAERQFRQGQMLLADYSQAATTLTAAAVAQEAARNQYNTSFMLLEEVVGTKISSLMTTP